MVLCDTLFIIFMMILFLNFCFLAFYCRFMPWLETRQKNKVKRNVKKNVDKNIVFTKVAEKEDIKQKFKKFLWWLIYNYFYGLMRYSLLLVGHFPSFKIRSILYRYVFNMDISKKTVIYGGCEIRSPWNFHADNCVISNNCIIDARNGIFIEDNVVFGAGVHIWTEEHDVNHPYFAVSEKNRASVVIEKHVWICSDSTILPGVHIGEGAVLASRACATKDLEDFNIYGGIPAKKIGIRNKNLKYILSGKPTYYFY